MKHSKYTCTSGTNLDSQDRKLACHVAYLRQIFEGLWSYLFNSIKMFLTMTLNFLFIVLLNTPQKLL